MHSDDKKDTLTPEEIEHEAFLEEVLEAQRESLEQARLARQNGEKKKRKMPRFARLMIWFMAIILVFNTFAIIFQIYSIPAIEFLKVSSQLSAQEDIQTYKKAIVEISTGESKGTGFAITNDGLIVTNAHVVNNALTLTAIFPDDGIYKAEVVESYPEIDIALVKVIGKDLPYLKLAQSSSYTKGQHVYFIGNPLYFTGIANEGTILESTYLSDWTDPVMMMDAPVYRGNSGSPVINEDGEVIGIVFATIKDKEYGKVGLYVPIEVLSAYRREKKE